MPWPQSSIQATGKCSGHRHCKCLRVHRTRLNQHIWPRSPADGPRKNAIESLQKQIEFHVGEAHRLRYVQNSHAVVSRLPEELLAEVFPYIVESGIQNDDSRFAKGTFNFLRVFKHWNEVAVSLPRLWRWWVPGAVKAWPLFHSRSKDTPIFLKWRPRVPFSALADISPGVPKRIHHLDFNGTSEQLVELWSAFGSNSSNISSLRLEISVYGSREPRKDLVRFFTSSFPKLSHLAFVDFLPDSSSPIFTTSNLTSFKLSFPHRREQNYTLSQFSQLLQRHPNLQELVLSSGALPLLERSSSPLVPLILPRLAILRLYGSEAAILGLVDLINMSSPLHNVVIGFKQSPKPTVADLAGAVQKILVAYYECQGLKFPREIHHFTILYDPEVECLVFRARSRPGLTPDLSSSLKLQFQDTDELVGDAVVKETFPLFPLNSVRKFTVEGPDIYGNRYRGMLQKMKDLSYLQLNKQDISLVLQALHPGDQNSSRVIIKVMPIHPCVRR